MPARTAAAAAAAAGAALLILSSPTAAAAAAVATAASDPSAPADLHGLECAVHTFAYAFGTAQAPAIPSAPAALHDALNLGNCTKYKSAATSAVAPTAADVVADTVRIAANKLNADAARLAAIQAAAASTFYVSASGGSDANDGRSAAHPFASLARARAAAAAAAKPGAVLIAAGKYFVNETLALGAADSQVSWAASPAGAAVVVSGGVALRGLDWQPTTTNPKVFVASVGNVSRALLSDEERAFWARRQQEQQRAAHPNKNHIQETQNEEEASEAGRPEPPPHSWGAPPARWNTLHVDGVRQVRARFPNGNPQDNSGLCFSKIQHDGEGCDGYLSAQGNAYADKADQKLPGSRTVASLTSALDRTQAPASPVTGGPAPLGTFHYRVFEPPTGHPVYNKPMPDWTWANTSPLSYWDDPLSRPAGVKYGADISKTYANAATAVVHMFHSGLWGGWQYQVSGQDAASQSLLFSHGGYQEARGSGITTQHYFVENVLEELDAPAEFFHDPVAGKLYFYPNTTTAPSASEVVAPVLSAIFRVEGASDVAFSGLTFTETRATYLDQYEMPSGGDWAVHRGASLEIVDSDRINVSGCTFDQVGGNGVLLSRHVGGAVVEDCEFVHTGDSGIVAVGVTDGILGDAPTYPDGTIIRRNVMREIGVFGKQTSCYFQALAAHTQLTNNLCFNGPRAGINWNDGFAGGNNVSGNLVFNMVRETGDHGPYNSWDRQPYLTNSGVTDGYPASDKPAGHGNASILKAQDWISQNFFINGYNGVWTIDHDDGSQFFNDTRNFMVFGGCKNYLGNRKSCDANVIVHPGISARSSGGRRCQTDDNKVFMDQYHGDNHCFTQDGVFYTMDVLRCEATAIDPHVYRTFNNTLYSAGANFSNGPCTSFPDWQATGQDRGSVVLPLPAIDDIVAMGKAVLLGVGAATPTAR